VKNRPKLSQIHFCQNQHIPNFSDERSWPKISATALIIEKLPKGNNRPIGENSPNLVTLLANSNYILFRLLAS
jgi:hypothetical protein